MNSRHEGTDDAQNQIRVVVADDERFIRELLDHRLASMGCATSQAADGEEAWTKILETNPTLAFVDLDMPVLDGYDLIARIRAHPRTHNIPVIVITSSDQRDSVDRAFALGATSFLMKPVRWSTFDSHVRYLLRLTDCAGRAEARMRTAEAASLLTRTVCLRALAAARHDFDELRQRLEDLAIRLNDLDTSSLRLRLCRLANDVAGGRDTLRRAAAACETIPAQVVASDCPVPLVDVLAAAAEACEPHADAPVDIDIADDVAGIHIGCNPDSLALAVGQLLDNALRHGRSEAPVRLAAIIHDDFMLTISIEDRGPGMTPEFLNACLAPAAAADADIARSAEAVGLILARAIIEAHGGRLEVRSGPGAGTMAMLSIPPHRVWLDRGIAA